MNECLTNRDLIEYMTPQRLTPERLQFLARVHAHMGACEICSALIAEKRALCPLRVKHGKRLEQLVRWCTKYVGQKTVVDAQRVRWLVEYAFILLMRNCEVYNKVGARGSDEE